VVAVVLYAELKIVISDLLRRRHIVL
jgi:hypothetical protein